MMRECASYPERIIWPNSIEPSELHPILSYHSNLWVMVHQKSVTIWHWLIPGIPLLTSPRVGTSHLLVQMGPLFWYVMARFTISTNCAGNCRTWVSLSEHPVIPRCWLKDIECGDTRSGQNSMVFGQLLFTILILEVFLCLEIALVWHPYTIGKLWRGCTLRVQFSPLWILNKKL